jgi:Flp pilus assembly protein TadG
MTGSTGLDKLNHRRWSLSKPHDERGSATVFVIGFALVLFLCAGLVIDGGLAINKRMSIADDAEQAARIGADSIDVTEYQRHENLVIDQGLARQRIAGYLSDLGYGADNWTADINADDVSVSVRDTSKTYILNLFHVRFPVRASAQAVPDTGQTNAGQPNAGQPNGGQPAPASQENP